MEELKWITKNGNSFPIKIKSTSEYMNDFTRTGAKVKVINEKKKNDLKNELKSKNEELQEFLKENGYYINEEQAKKYNDIHTRIEEIQYDLEKNYFKEISENNIKKDRKTGFDSSVYVKARKDDLKNHEAYKAMYESSAGVYINRNTPVDDILEGKNKKVSAKEFYNTFTNTRNELKKKYGNEVTLYRVESQQMKKPTKNYGSSIEYTKQYGDDVKKYNIKVNDIVAIYTNRRGTYEDIIVAVDGIDKYIKRS